MEALTLQALIGTANHHDEAQSLPEIDALLGQHGRERKLLLQAGALAVYRRAGWQPGSMTLPQPAPPESAQEIPATLHHTIHDLLHAQYDEIRSWALQRLCKKGWRLPYQFLPSVLARSDRAEWMVLLGERGRWLQAWNLEWHTDQPAVAMTTMDAVQREQIWLEQSFPLRCAALAAQADADLATARTWIQAGFAKEKAEQRLALLHCWQPYAQPAADADWYERLLADRSQAVRQLAASWLASHPDTALAQRLVSRAKDVLVWEKSSEAVGLFSKVRAAIGQKSKPSLRVNPPQDLPKEWERDGCINTPPPGMGPRSWWLQQLVALVAPGTWTAQVQADIPTVITVMAEDEWADALLAGICEATIRFQDHAWASVLSEMLPKTILQGYRDGLYKLLPVEQKQTLLIELVEQANYVAAAEITASLSLSGHFEQPLLSSLKKMLSKSRLEEYSKAHIHAAGFAELLQLLQQLLLVSSDTAIHAITERIDDLTVLTTLPNWYYQQYASKIARLSAQARLKQHLIKEIPL